MRYLRTIILIICMVTFLSQPQTIVASEFKVQDKVELKEESVPYSFEIDVQKEEAYAGCEFAVACPAGYEIKKVTYNVNGNTAGPVVARGYTWFSYFSGKNEFSGTVTATVQFTVDESVDLTKEVAFELSQVKVYIVTDAGVETQLTEPNQAILVAFEQGEVKEEEASEVEETTEEEEATAEKDNLEITNQPTKVPTTTPEKTGQGEKNQEESKQNESKQKENNQEENKDLEKEQQVTITPTEEITVIPTKEPTMIEQATNDVSEEKAVETDATLNNTNLDQYSKTQSVNWILFIALIISLIGNAVLGYLIYKHKKMEVTQSEKE